jgi:hypothetical protein
MTYEEAAKLIAHHAALLSQFQRLKDAQAEAITSMDRAMANLDPLMRMARTVLDDHCRAAEERIRAQNVVKLRPSVTLPSDRQT